MAGEKFTKEDMLKEIGAVESDSTVEEMEDFMKYVKEVSLQKFDEVKRQIPDLDVSREEITSQLEGLKTLQILIEKWNK